MRMTWHAAKARQLISAAGGPKECAELLGLSLGHVYRFQRGECFLTAPQIVALESAAMVPLYSQDMAALIADPSGPDTDPVTAAVSASSNAAQLAETLVRALTDQHISEAERRELRPFIVALRAHLDSIERTVEGDPRASVLAAE